MAAQQNECELITLAAVSRQLGVNSKIIARAPNDFFPCHRLGGRKYVFAKDLQAWLTRKVGGGGGVETRALIRIE